MSSYDSGFNGNDVKARRDRVVTPPKLTKYRLFNVNHNHHSLTSKTAKRVNVLRSIEGQHMELEKQFSEERAALEEKYNQLLKDLYRKRYEVVNGITEVVGVKADEATEEKGIPNFWLSAMQNSTEFLIMKHDIPALRYLKDIKCCRMHDPQGFKLELLFDPNPFFKNPVLTKTYHMIDEPERIWKKEIGTVIEWYPGQSLTTIPRKNPKNAKPTTAAQYCYSFFKFFRPVQYENDAQSVIPILFEDVIEYDRKIGLMLRDNIIPKAVLWFTGEAVESDELDSSGDDSDEGDLWNVVSTSTDDEVEYHYQEDGKRKRMNGWTDAMIETAGLALQGMDLS